MIIAIIVIAVLCLLFAAYVIALKPRPEPKTSVEPLKVDYAHRGLYGRDEAVENTMSAFHAAERAGYGIELDVRLSSDGEIIVFHDDTLERMTGRTERIDELTASELSWIDLQGTYERIPLLEDVLSMIDEKVPLCIELKGKDEELCEKLCTMMDQYDRYYSVESFNPYLLNWYRKNRPRIVRGQLTMNAFRDAKKCAGFFGKLAITTMVLNFLSKPDYISYDLRHAKSLPVQICRKLYHAMTFVWTVEDMKTYEEMKADGNLVIFQKILPPVVEKSRKK